MGLTMCFTVGYQRYNNYQANGTYIIVEFKTPDEAILKIEEAKDHLNKLKDIVCWELNSKLKRKIYFF